MTASQLTSVLQHLRRVLRRRQAKEVTDGLLLQRFADQREEAAFEVLVERHGPLVWNVCYRILQSEHDAEDAFQATFLVLACKAGSIRKQQSVASWLYGVAYRVALKARTDAAKRYVREKQWVAMSPDDRGSELERREAHTVLHAELRRLPEKYRAPIVLFYLESKTYEETARQLGCPIGTIKSRLARGRELLRVRLARRGLVLSAGGLATALAPGTSSAVPVAIAAATVKAAMWIACGSGMATGLLSGKALAWAEAIRRSMGLAKLANALATLLAVTVLATGAGALTYRVLADKSTDERSGQLAAAERSDAQANPRKSPAPRDMAKATTPSDPILPRQLAATGLVLTSDGKPLAGATVYLRDWATWHTNRYAGDDILAQVTTDAQGRFALQDVAAHPFPAVWHMRRYPWDILVLAKGQALAWQHLTPQAQKRLLRFNLVPGATLQGQVVHPNGQPLGGAQVSVLEVAPLGSYDQNTTPGWREGALNLEGSRLAPSTTTDVQGRFVFDNLPHGMRIRLRLSAPCYYEKTIVAATTDQPQPDLITVWEDAGTRTTRIEPIHTGPCTLALQPVPLVPGCCLCGQVIAADTGQPIAGARVSLVDEKRTWFGATAGPEGRFAIAQVPAGPLTMRTSGPEQNTDYVQLVTRLDPSGNGRDIEQIIRLPRAIPTTGQVVDEETGQGIPHVYFTYQPQATSPGELLQASFLSQTDVHGRFRHFLPPGSGTLTAYGGSSGYRKPLVRTLEIKPDQSLGELRLALGDWGTEVQGRVLDPDGHGGRRSGRDP